MQLKILNEHENKLFRRKEVVFEISSASTPKREEVIGMIAKKFSSPEGAIKVKKIKGSFGNRTFQVHTNIYSSKKDKDAVELVKKKDTELEKKKAEAEKAAKEASKPKEDAVEEKAG